MSDLADGLDPGFLVATDHLVEQLVVDVLAVAGATEGLGAGTPHLTVPVVPHQVGQLVHQVLQEHIYRCYG